MSLDIKIRIPFIRIQFVNVWYIENSCFVQNFDHKMFPTNRDLINKIRIKIKRPLPHKQLDMKSKLYLKISERWNSILRKQINPIKDSYTVWQITHLRMFEKRQIKTKNFFSSFFSHSKSFSSLFGNKWAAMKSVFN